MSKSGNKKRKNSKEKIRVEKNRKRYEELAEVLSGVYGKKPKRNKVEILKLAYEYISEKLKEPDLVVPRVYPPLSPDQKRGEKPPTVNKMSSTLDQPLLFSDSFEFPSSLLVETPSMQQESSLTLSSSEQDGESFLFCPEEVYREDSGDEMAQKHVPTVLPNHNEVIKMEEGSSYSSLSSHYASPSTPAYGKLTHMSPMNNNTIVYAPWLVSTTFSPLHTTPLHHINCSPPNSSPIVGMLYSPPSIFTPHLF